MPWMGCAGFVKVVLPYRPSDKLIGQVEAPGGKPMCWRLIVAIGLMTAVGMGSVRAQMGTPAALTVIQAGTLIDGQSETPRKSQLIFVRGERIEKVVDASAGIPKDAKVVDLSSFTVLPGLIDAHTHLFLCGEDP